MNIDDVNIEEDVVLIDKPSGWTSFDVVAKLRGQLSRRYKEQTGEKRKIKVGHSGTLDPAATGLLVLGVGKATKKLHAMTGLDKVYVVEATLGVVSTTGDSEGELTYSNILENIRISRITEVLEEFVGEIEQTPHKYSAIKVDGVRAYKLARAGKEFEMKSRRVTIYSIDQIGYSEPVLKFTCKVSSGTYIRTLVEDIGKELGCGAYMSSLRRTQVGEFLIEDASAF